MKSYRSGSIVIEEIPLVDESGVILQSTSVMYRVTDESNVELTPLTVVDSYIEGDISVTICTQVMINTIDINKLRGLRVVELRVTLIDGTTRYISLSYIVESESSLVVMTNSYQTLNEARLMAMDMPDMLAWEASADRKRSAAMIEAFFRIGLLKYDIYGLLIPSRENTVVTNRLNLDMMDTQNVSYYRTRPSLSTLPLDEFNALPSLFTDAVKKAQISEADIILGGDPIQRKREEGIVSDSVGESSKSFRSGVPLTRPVSKRTLIYLSGWVSFKAHLMRS